MVLSRDARALVAKHLPDLASPFDEWTLTCAAYDYLDREIFDHRGFRSILADITKKPGI